MSRRIRSHILAFALLATAVLLGPPAGQAHDHEAASEPVAVGQEAPDFTLPDPDGKDYAAAGLRGEKNLLLVFFRGAW